MSKKVPKNLDKKSPVRYTDLARNANAFHFIQSPPFWDGLSTCGSVDLSLMAVGSYCMAVSVGG